MRQAMRNMTSHQNKWVWQSITNYKKYYNWWKWGISKALNVTALVNNVHDIASKQSKIWQPMTFKKKIRLIWQVITAMNTTQLYWHWKKTQWTAYQKHQNYHTAECKDTVYTWSQIALAVLV